MSTIQYKSDHTYYQAVLKYYAFAFVASCFTHIPMGIAGVAMNAPAIPMMLTMAIVQVTTWLIVSNTMCLTFQAMIQAKTPPTLPAPTEKITEVNGNTDITSIKRTYR